MMIIRIRKYLWLLILPLLIFQCTENPFFDDEITQHTNTKINGTVLLSDGSPPGDIYVWMNGFNLSTVTDEKGDFEIEIPYPKAQPGGGLNGIFNLYYYVANYQYTSSSFLVINGSIQYSDGDLDANGRIQSTIVLNKMLDIKLTVEPGQINENFKDPLLFTITLDNLIDTVIVKTHHNQWGTPSSLIFLKEGAPAEQALFIQGQPAELRNVVITEETSWFNSFLFSPNFFSEGNYEVRPYLQIVQDGLPEELLLSIDETFTEVSYRYLFIPIRMKPDTLHVSEL